MKVTGQHNQHPTAAATSNTRRASAEGGSELVRQRVETVTFTAQAKALAASEVTESRLHDFTRISPGEMRAVSQALYDSDETDLTWLRVLNLGGKPIGVMGSRGELVNLDPAMEAALDSRATDYLSASESQIQALEQSGGEPDLRKAARSLKHVLSVPLSRQRSAE